MAESFFASLKCELIDRRRWQTKTQARHAVFYWIEAGYNSRRRHSALNDQSPVEFERTYQHQLNLNPNPVYPPNLHLDSLHPSPISTS